MSIFSVFGASCVYDGGSLPFDVERPTITSTVPAADSTGADRDGSIVIVLAIETDDLTTFTGIWSIDVGPGGETAVSYSRSDGIDSQPCVLLLR